ncbi:aquaporin [Hyphomicrobium sp.]|uniref:aquaporin n=1 Tax=Hyphomicrobium sp. TaxID=82 RepID=UPI002FDD4A8B
MNIKALVAEFIGTFMLTGGVLGAAFYSFGAPAGAGGIVGVALSIGITVFATLRAIGHISGGHYNPAVTVGLVAGGRFPFRDAIPYIVAQCLGAIAVTGVFATIGHAPASYAANGYGSLSMINASLMSVVIIEVVLTAFFVIVVLGSTRASAPAGFAPLSIGLALTAIHLMSIPVSNTSVNPARSLGPAVFAGGEALSQIWVFWVAPIAGALIGAILYRWLDD